MWGKERVALGNENGRGVERSNSSLGEEVEWDYQFFCHDSFSRKSFSSAVNT